VTEETTMFALDDFETEDVARMQIFPPGKFVAIGWIDFAGPGHPKTKQIADEASRKRLFEERQKQSNNRWKPEDKSPDQVDREYARMVADRIVGWSIKGRVKHEDTGEESIAEITYTHDTAMEMFLDRRKGWLYGQCAEFLATVENFMPASARS